MLRRGACAALTVLLLVCRTLFQKSPSSLSKLMCGLAVYPLALALGYCLDLMSVPLSWMIGAMIASGAMLVAQRPVLMMPGSRQLAQMVVAGSVGLSFNEEALLAALAVLAPIVGATLLGIVCSYVAARLLVRITGLPITTAMLAALSVGPVESAVLAMRYGASPTPVIFSQSLRIMLIIVILPPLIVWSGSGIGDPSLALRAVDWNPLGTLTFLLLGTVASFAAVRLRLPNPYFMGPLIAGITCRLTDVPVTAYPYWALTLAQMLLGIWLGASLDRNFLRTTPRTLWGLLASIVVLLLLTALIGLGLFLFVGIPWEVALLATAPGGVAEMALTAKILQQGVALVISFHLTRIFILQLVSPPIVHWLSKRHCTNA